MTRGQGEGLAQWNGEHGFPVRPESRLCCGPTQDVGPQTSCVGANIRTRRGIGAIDDMSTHITGQCLCGAITYEITGKPLVSGLCNCTDCQKQTGSSFSHVVIFKAEDYRQHGETGSHDTRGDSGDMVTRHFCRNCGSPIRSGVPSMSHLAIVKAGTLEHPGDFPPSMELYCKDRLSWLPTLEKVTRYEAGSR
ncbi:GFA family protein [Acetobacter sp. DsW_063]|uniref:GFA family protein n=1 Tax=Acetobacter sp. DsW_063 TaxID=1514894 RepID=UPI0013025A02|nr:GFA family protein [Acetobacter sp. DsW_063]